MAQTIEEKYAMLFTRLSNELDIIPQDERSELIESLLTFLEDIKDSLDVEEEEEEEEEEKDEEEKDETESEEDDDEDDEEEEESELDESIEDEEEEKKTQTSGVKRNESEDVF
jgi:hypothetical protein